MAIGGNSAVLHGAPPMSFAVGTLRPLSGVSTHIGAWEAAELCARDVRRQCPDRTSGPPEFPPMTPSRPGVLGGNQPLFTILSHKSLGPAGIGGSDHSTSFAVDVALVAVNADIRRQSAQRDAVS